MYGQVHVTEVDTARSQAGDQVDYGGAGGNQGMPGVAERPGNYHHQVAGLCRVQF